MYLDIGGAKLCGKRNNEMLYHFGLIYLHWPSRGHIAPFLVQLQGRSGSLVLKILALCFPITFFIFGVVLYDIFTVFWLKSLYSGCPFGKWRRRILKKFSPTFVLTFIEYGGFHQITSLFLVLFLLLTSELGGVYFKLKLYPALFKASW